jgi:DNA-binding NarL/FixJ family response regulator
MRVILIGDARDRARLRAQLNGNADVVGEFPTLAAARRADVDADAMVLAADEVRPPPSRAKRASASLAEAFGGGGPDTTYDADEDIAREALTPREIQVLELLAEGLPNKAIAARLLISDQTVKFHVASIAGKLGAVNRTDVVRRAVRRGLIAL